MPEVALISDSHIPTRAPALPAGFERRIERADHVIHAGDVTDPETLAHVRDLADGNLTAVRGNMDRGLDLPHAEAVEIDGVTFVATHGTGDPSGYKARVAGVVRQFGGEDAIGVAGHTHETLDTTYEGIRLLNPGSVTGAPPASRATMMTARVDGGTLQVTLHER